MRCKNVKAKLQHYVLLLGAILCCIIGIAIAPAADGAFAASDDCEMILLPESWCNHSDGSGITNMIQFVVDLLTGGVVVVGTIGIIICGFLWMTARENEAQVAKAKKRLVEIVVGMFLFVGMNLAVNLLFPTIDNSGGGGGSTPRTTFTRPPSEILY